MKDDGFITPKTLLLAGQCLVDTSTVTGIFIFVYYLLAGQSRAIRLVTVNFWSFAKTALPYLISFLVCWYFLLTLEKMIISNHLIMVMTSKHYLASKIILNVSAVVFKHYLFGTRSNFFRVILFVGHLVLMATSEVMSHEKYAQEILYKAVILLFWLTMLILVAPENAYQHLSINERLTWKRCSMVYGLLTSIMFTVHYSLAPENRYAIADAILLVAAVYVQLIFLCITYFSDGQQLLRNMVGMGTYNPMADSLDLYFTIDSIVSKMDAYILSISSV